MAKKKVSQPVPETEPIPERKSTMPPIRLNFEGVSTDGFTPWEEKVDHEFTIFEIKPDKGQDSGEPYLKFTFKQVGGNRKAWSNFSLQPQSLWRLKKLLVDLGYDEDSLESEFEFDPEEILGKTVLLRFGPQREFNGKKNQDVVAVTAA